MISILGIPASKFNDDRLGRLGRIDADGQWDIYGQFDITDRTHQPAIERVAAWPQTNTVLDAIADAIASAFPASSPVSPLAPLPAGRVAYTIQQKTRRSTSLMDRRASDVSVHPGA